MRTTPVRSRSGTDWLRTQIRRVGDQPEPTVPPEVAASADIERWLQSRGIQYAPAAAIPMDLIDTKRSRANQARRDAILPESVDRYATAMRNGAVFPPIVVYLDGRSLVIIDGNNRHAAAARVGLDTIDGFVIAEDTPSELIHLLTVEANARHGVTPDSSWRYEQAFALTAMGWSDEDAAEAAGLSVASLRGARSVQNAEARAKNLRIGGFADMPASAKVALAPVKDDAVFYHLSKLAIATSMTTDEIRDVTRALKNILSESGRVDYINQVAKERTLERAARKVAAPGKHSRVTSPRVAFVAGIGKVLSVRPEALVSQIATRQDRALLESRLDELKRRIQLIDAALGSLGDLGE